MKIFSPDWVINQLELKQIANRKRRIIEEKLFSILNLPGGNI